VALYCKKVLIDPHPKGLLPEWLRFLCGVIDSADLPLNISRESMQDSLLIQKLNRVVTKRFLKFLDKQAKSDGDKYLEFFKEFSRFLKEGICTDQDHKADLAKLLRFESSLSNAGEMTSLDEYITRMKDGQKEIYYLVGPSRKSIEAGPFLEAFQARGLEVIYLFESIDDYMLGIAFVGLIDAFEKVCRGDEGDCADATVVGCDGSGIGDAKSAEPAQTGVGPERNDCSQSHGGEGGEPNGADTRFIDGYAAFEADGGEEIDRQGGVESFRELEIAF
jgi:hypothetical protein